jgi:ABC-2 type transport system permease protein
MREIGIIIRREFLERVRNRAFLIGTFAFPLFMFGVLWIPTMMGGEGTVKKLALVDEAPAGISDRFVAALTAAADSDAAIKYEVEEVPGPFAAARPELVRRVLADSLDGFVVLPADVVTSNEIVYRATNIANQLVLRDLRTAGSAAVLGARLERAGLEVTDLAELVKRVDIDEAAITDTGEEGRGAETTFFFAYIAGFLVYFVTAIYGMVVLRSVIEEKTNRISEVMVSSVRASHMMLGKIVGVGSAALLQVAVWIGAIVLITTRSPLLEKMGVPSELLAGITLPPGQAALFLAYFALGFLEFAALFAALGAAMNTEQEAQSMQMVLMVPLFLPLLFLMQLTGEPLSRLSTVLGVFPLTAPIAMPMRIATVSIPPIQIAASLALLVLGLFVIAWLAGKVYRIGILSTGKRPTMAELVRWLREA